MHRQIILFILTGVLSIGQTAAQRSAGVTASAIGVPGTAEFYYADRTEPPRAIAFETGSVRTAHFLANINQYFSIPAAFTFTESESGTDNLGMRHRLFEQYYNGIPVEGMGYRVHEKGGYITAANGRAIRKINVDTQTTISEEQAFYRAIQYLNTKDSVFRHGRKLIASKDFTFKVESFAVAFQFDIDVSLIERWRISIDARNGQLINKVSLVNTCLNESTHPDPQPLPYGTGTGLTNYYGTRTIRVEKYEGGSSRLVGQTENGGSIATYDFRNGPIIILLLGFPYNVSDFYSLNNTYTTSYQKPAVSVQWAAEQAYEYYFKKHNRNSFDNNGSTIKSYVHVDQDLNNAFWTGKLLAFGDGSNNNPLVELDVVSHELTHGVTQYEAGLQYYDEPGALNESFSDIFSKAVEFHTFGDTATWQLARHYREGGLRDMSNPNLKNQPDTYAGHMWYTGYKDNGGVHINSGVQNFWFYLLCEGGSGVNDHQVSYSVNAIGMDTAIKIAYRNLTEYLTSTSDYFDSRIGSMLATADLYGKNSAVYQEVDKAWDAVGVIDEPIITSLDLYDITATTVKIKGSLMPRGDSVTYHFEYGTTPAYESATPAYAYTNTVEGTLTGLQSATRYYLRLVATNENGVTFFTSEFTTLSLAPLVNIKQTVDVTETTATLYGAINPNSLPTSFYFEYGPTPAFGQVTPTYPLSDTTEFLDVAAAVTNLQPRQTYYYRLVALNSFASPRTEAVSFFAATKPVISSFAPVSAPVGTAITITGYNFNPSPEKNQVSFGATRAAVLSASSTEISVEVPAGASFGSITLLDAESGLTAKSGKEFVPTFTGEFKKSSLQLRVGSTEPIYQTLVQDMDGDNKPDIVTRNNQGFSVLINVNQGGDITDESFVRSTFSAEYGLGILSLADFDGNGLQDIVGQYQRALRIYPNFSVPGYIFFGTPIDLPFTDYWEDMVVNDFDMDGRIDIATTRSFGGDSSTVTIIRNQNPKGSLSANNFEHRYVKILPYLVYSLNAGDVNNDGSPDLVVGPYYTDFLSILINNCQPGVFEFEENTIPVGTVDRWARYLAYDLNEDGWKDITFHSPHLVGKVSVFENKGTLPDISLAVPVVALNEYNASSVEPGDINGDGKVDLMVGTDRREFIFLENNRDAGEHLSDSSFTKFGQYGMSLVNSGSGEVQHQMTINDLNGDGRPEIITAYSYNFYPHDGYQMEVWQNSPDDCPDPTRITVNASGYTATLTLPPGTTLDHFEIEYSPSGADYWWQASTTTLSNLSRGYAYQLRARAKCYLGFTAYHHINFVTECVNTNDFTISNIGFNSVTLASANLILMEVQYSPAGKNQWKIMPEYANQISDLLPGTVYDLRFRGRCNVQSDFKYQQFTTLCPMLSELLIDDLTYNKAVLGWSSNYPGNALLEYSTDNISWILIDESQIMFPLVPGQKYFIRGALACTNVNSDFRYQSFTTPCPQLSALRIDTVTPFSARIYWSDESNTGNYTITYSTAGSSETTIETSSASFTLDGLTPGTHYRVAVAPHCLAAPHFTATTFGTVCYVPFNLSADAITHTTAELSWNDNFSGLPYVVEYSIAGSNVWITAETALTNFSLSELRPGTKYEARVHITCTSETAPYVSLFFETLLYAETAFFPNPTDGKITIQPSKNLIGSPFSISDNLGRIVAHGELPGYTVDLSPFSSGIFTLKIEGEKPIRIFKH